MKHSGKTKGAPASARKPAPRHQAGPGFHQIALSVEPRTPARWPAISVCMIVKNEAANLRPCLEALQDLAAEIIVVDTGSTDETVEIARSLGATVYYFQWIDDFAAARNASLSYATKDWILILDADDRLNPEAIAQLKRVVTLDRADVYQCKIASEVIDMGLDMTLQVRLFRNRAGIYFVGAIHESTLPVIQRLGLRLAATDITIQHLGYHVSQAVLLGKRRRNLAMIEQQMAREPNNVDLFYYRGQCLGGLDDEEGALRDLEHYLASTHPATSFHYKRFWSYAGIADILERRQDWARMESQITQALAEYPRHPYFMYLLGQAQLEQSQAAPALDLLLAAHAGMQGEIEGFRSEPGPVSFAIARCYRLLKQYQEALTWARQAAHQAPEVAAPRALLARLYVETGQVAQAEALLRELLPGQGYPESWLVLAELRRRQGRFDEARAAIVEAGKQGLAETRVQEMLQRAQASQLAAVTKTQNRPISLAQGQGLIHLTAGEYERAAQCFAEAIEAAPTDPDNYRYLAVVLDKLGQSEPAMDAWKLAKHWQEQAAA